jgi:hypothetical protein
MLVPLTDSTNLYTAMMLELINSSKDGAHSHIGDAPRGYRQQPRRRFSILDRLRGRRRVSTPVASPAM